MASKAQADARWDVLIVDDDDDSADLMTAYVQRRDCRVRRMRTGEEALVASGARIPDLVVLDLLLPGLSGWQVVAALREEKSTRSCPIVVCSVLDRQDYPQDVEGALPKPYTRGQVEHLLDLLLPVREA